MSRSRDRRTRLQPFVPLIRDTIKTDAWRTMSHGARLLYIHLKSFYGPNHNAVWCSTRDAQEALGAGGKRRDTIGRWYRELVHYGFIREVSGACLGTDGKGKAARWRLTECSYMGEIPTREYLRWDGTKFEEHRQRPPSYYNRRDRIRSKVFDHKKQNPGLTVESTLDSTASPPADSTVSPPKPESGLNGESIDKRQTGHTVESITTLPLVRADKPRPLTYAELMARVTPDTPKRTR